MAGSVLYKKGRHWSRDSGVTEGPEDGYRELIRTAHRLTNYQISESNLTQLVSAIAYAGHQHRLATRLILPTRYDSERQLSAMLKLNDAELETALKDCDTATRTAIGEAENSLPEIKWITVPSETDSLTVQIYSPESRRDAIRLALSNIKTQTNKRGRKEKPHQLDLARSCLRVWQEYCPPRTTRILEFLRVAFDAAGMPLGDKSLEALLSRVRKGRIK